ncbi:MAG: aldo/keto reductase [Gammaproteobacteria bacterium]|nr:aldo/keto reductase [Gammaproteobacteria bacterium]
MIERIPFGNTGHDSSRMIFGAAALGGMRQDRADKVLEVLDEYGINHLDVAASYGDAELRLAPWLATRRSDFFLATKTGERTAQGAIKQLHTSLERLGVDQIDLIQMHNLVNEDEWQVALGPGGALESLIEARAEGLVRFIGVTGHGTHVAARHLSSLERFPFDSVLLPYSFSMMQGDYADDFEALHTLCQQRGVAIQTIKAIARRRWHEDDDGKRFSWYKPLDPGDALKRAVHYVLSRPGLFLNTSSDATLLPIVLAAANDAVSKPDDDDLRRDTETYGIEPLFVRGVSDQV